MSLAKLHALGCGGECPELNQQELERLDLKFMCTSDADSKAEQLHGGTLKLQTFVYQTCIEVLATSYEQRADVIDFDDMLYIPLRFPLDVVLRHTSFRNICIDEAQDTNPARLFLVRRALAPNGRVIAFGDPLQAIYGFSGAGTQSLNEIEHKF